MKKYMYASSGRRFLAYLIDVIIIGVISSLLFTLFLNLIKFDNEKYNNLQNTVFEGLTNQYSYNSTQLQEYNAKVNEFIQIYMFRTAVQLGITIVLGSFYYVLLSLLWKGKTIGRWATRLKVMSIEGEGKLKVSQILLRELVGSAIIYNVVGLPILIVSAVLATTGGRSLVDRMSKTALVFEQPIEFSDDSTEYNYNNYNNDDYNNNYNNKREDSIDAEVKDVNNDNNNNNDNLKNNDDKKNDDSDDEYQVF